MRTIRKYYGGRKPSGCKIEGIGEKIRYYRLQKGWSQLRLAEGICSDATISGLERGRINVTFPLLARLADKLEIPFYELCPPDQNHDFPNRSKLEIVDLLISRGDFEQAQQMLDLLIGRDDLIEVDRQQWQILQADLLNTLGKPNEAIETLQPLVDQIDIQQNVEDEWACQVYNLLGAAHFKLCDFARAYSAFKRGYQISLRFTVFDRLAALVTHNLGITCNQLGMGDEASVYLNESYAYFQKNSDLKAIANSLYELAIATKNESYVTEARNLYESMNNLKMAFWVRQFHAVHIGSKHDYMESVQELHTVALELDKLGEVGHCIFILSRAVMICLDHADVTKAQYYLDLATIYKKKSANNNPYDVALYYRARARCNLCLGNYDDCIADAQKSSEMYDIVSMYSDSADSLEVVMEAYQCKGMHEAAYEVSKKVNNLLRRSNGS